VDAIRVYVYDRMLLLTAAHEYSLDLSDIYAHVSNTARGAELPDFHEDECVLLLHDLAAEISQTRGLNGAAVVEQIRQGIHTLTAELFKAYKGEYSVFCPVEECFELYGVDFLVGSDFTPYLLEVWPSVYARKCNVSSSSGESWSRL
jgi:hypothetical protein